MKKSKLILIFLLFSIKSIAQETNQQSIAERLGYDKDAKLLIIHADDIGLSSSENIASFNAIDSGSVNSGSVMMPSPWVLQVAEYARLNKDKHDLGLHLVLTSEWMYYKMSPIASKNKVPSLITDYGYFHDKCSKKMELDEIEIELRAQIELAYKMGINPTHIDTHIGCLHWMNKEIFEIYLKLSHEYKLPCLVDSSFSALFSDRNEFERLLEKYNVIPLDYRLTISIKEYEKDPNAYYINSLKTLNSGLSIFQIHTAFDNDEMKYMTANKSYWGSEWRQIDYDFFTSDTCKKILEEEDIILTNWREISKVVYH